MAINRDILKCRVVCGFGCVLLLILPRPAYAAVSKNATHRGGSVSHDEMKYCDAAK